MRRGVSRAAAASKPYLLFFLFITVIMLLINNANRFCVHYILFQQECGLHQSLSDQTPRWCVGASANAEFSKVLTLCTHIPRLSLANARSARYCAVYNLHDRVPLCMERCGGGGGRWDWWILEGARRRYAAGFFQQTT